MNDRWRWLNPTQPQTLQIAVMLLYLNAGFGLLTGVVASSVLFALVIIVAMAVGGFGIANDKRWGYSLGVAGAVLQVAMLFVVAGYSLLGVLDRYAISLLFDGALVALLLHPQSRDYQRIWFR